MWLQLCNYKIYILWQPIALRQPSRIKSPKRLVRHYPRSGIDAFGRWVTTVQLHNQDIEKWVDFITYT